MHGIIIKAISFIALTCLGIKIARGLKVILLQQLPVHTFMGSGLIWSKWRKLGS